MLVGQMVVTSNRCSWANKSEVLRDYHDNEWGKPLYGDLLTFEMLSLELMQAGLSWETILNKRKSLNEAFLNFNPKALIKLNQNDIEKYYTDDRVIKNKLKINAIFNNANKYFEIKSEFGSFNKYFWNFVNHQPIINNWETESLVPSKTPLSKKIADDLKQRGFKFIGPTIVYSFMQAIGMVNDHVKTCEYK